MNKINEGRNYETHILDLGIPVVAEDHVSSLVSRRRHLGARKDTAPKDI
jgi:hypothetical protein